LNYDKVLHGGKKMNRYRTALSRLLKPKKYPLYRITPLRYVFLHILLLALIMSSPGITHIYQSIATFTQLIEEKESEIPEFTINQGQLNLQRHEETTIALNNGTVTFTEDVHGKPTDILTFTKDQLLINQMNPVDYHNLNMFEDKASMLELVKVYTQSSYFYFMLIVFVLVLFQFTIILLKASFISLIAHWTALLFNRKSRFMNWFKMISFLLTLPTFIQYINLLVPNSFFNPLSWCIMILLAGAAGWYMPLRKAAK